MTTEFTLTRRYEPFPTAHHATPRRNSYQGHSYGYRGKRQNKESPKLSKPSPIRQSFAQVHRQHDTPQRDIVALSFMPGVTTSSMPPCITPTTPGCENSENRPRSGSIECSAGSAFHMPLKCSNTTPSYGSNKRKRKRLELKKEMKITLEDDETKERQQTAAAARGSSEKVLFPGRLHVQPYQCSTTTDGDEEEAVETMIITPTEVGDGIMPVDEDSVYGDDDDDSPTPKHMDGLDFSAMGFRPVYSSTWVPPKSPSTAGYTAPRDALELNPSALCGLRLSTGF